MIFETLPPGKSCIENTFSKLPAKSNPTWNVNRININQAIGEKNNTCSSALAILHIVLIGYDLFFDNSAKISSIEHFSNACVVSRQPCCTLVSTTRSMASSASEK